jgi:hypothetical protein
MDWDQISRNWDEMTRRMQPQSSLPYTGLSSWLYGGQVKPSSDGGDATPANQAVSLANQKDDAIAADTLV